jgi:hypothetical protein
MMIAVESPEALIMSYENLAAEVSVAESQKDLLSQFLRGHFQGVSAIVERENGISSLSALDSLKAEKQAREKKLVVKCLQCARSQQEWNLDASSVRVENARGNYEFVAAFQAVSAVGAREWWRVSLSPDSSGFCVKPKFGIGVNHVLSSEDFEVTHCKAENSSSRAHVFQSVEQAKMSIEELRGFRLPESVGEGNFLSARALFQPVAVKAQDRVKVVLDASSAFQLRAEGRALQSASKGQTVRVELNPLSGAPRFSSRRVIDALVVAPGEVAYVR